MQKVITINLNGVAYQVDESGYAALVAYLEGADRQLTVNPDRAEIVADLEQAIGDKCRAFLSPHKTVVAAAEVDQIIKEMGPVDGDSRADTSAAPAPAPASGESARSPKRLYRIRDGAMWEGVCTGLAAYTGIHVVFVRIAFLLLIVWTAGFGLIGYWILASSIPEAQTADDRAAAHGQPPFNAQELIDRATSNYASVADDRGWGRNWRSQRRAWRRQRRAQRWGMGWWGGAWSGWPPPAAAASGPYGSRIVSGVMVPVLGIAGVLWFVAFAWAVYSLVTTGQVLGEPLPDDLPTWGGVLILVMTYHLVAWPLHFARRRAAYSSFGGMHSAIAAGDGMMSLVVAGLLGWLGYHYIPEVREIIRTLPDVARSFGI